MHGEGFIEITPAISEIIKGLEELKLDGKISIN